MPQAACSLSTKKEMTKNVSREPGAPVIVVWRLRLPGKRMTRGQLADDDV